MELKLINDDGQSAASISASDTLFGREYNESLVHQVVTAYLANARSANRAQKGRSDVAKSTRKPFRQKGTGRARAGMASSPLWRGGGKIFPNSPEENFSHKLNRKMYRAGIGAILSQLVRENRLSVVENFTVDTPKTKTLAQKLKDMGMAEVMIITDSVDENLYLSSRNLPHVMVVEVGHADPVSLLRFANVLMTRSAVTQIEEMLA
ncbi:MAG: 50S ribosomal protein L4 [Nitrosomonadaceae bacterium]|jgi:large subunit ribosomal protein L4|nr:50S ribosomal protein L4 [Nitrosospira sp.]TSA53338.1 MAG: 50S ribosomal protein L4 [Nitrosomonadaceae bacterium]